MSCCRRKTHTWSNMKKHKLLLPTRTIMCIMGFFGITIAFLFRNALSYSLTELVPQVKSNTKDDVCFPNQTIYTKLPPEKLCDWTGGDQHLILGSFYWGYVVTHVPGGALAQKIGGRDTIILGTIIGAICSLLIPQTFDSCNTNALIVLRVIIGAGEGLVFPACSTWVAAWIPLKERTIAVCLIYSGIQFGGMFAAGGAGLLIAKYGPESPFYVFSIISIVWCIAAFFICSNDPSSHYFISETEKKYLQRELGELQRDTNLSTPWRAILTSLPVWAIIVAQMGHTWGLFFVITNLPKYMKDVLGFNIKDNGWIGVLVYTLMWIVTIFIGFLSDYLIKHKASRISFLRKLCTTIAAIGPAVFLVSASYAGCDQNVAVAMFTLAMGCMGTYYAGAKANCVDVSPNFTGVIMAIVNGAGGAMGIVVPFVVKAVVPNSYMKEWRVAFWAVFGVMFASAIFNIAFGTSQIQPWNDTHDTTIDATKTKELKENDADAVDDDNDDPDGNRPK